MARMLVPAVMAAQILSVVRKPYRSRRARRRNGHAEPTMFLQDSTRPYATARLLVLNHSPSESVVGL